MNKSTRISEMQKFHFGSRIICTDGDDGYVTHVVCDPDTCRLTHIGVKLGRLFGKSVQLPYDTVIDATGDGVALGITRAEVTAAGNPTVSGAILDSKSTIENVGSGGRGTLSLIAVHPRSGEIAYIVAHNVRPNQGTLLREEYIEKVATGVISVNISAAALQALPPYRSDSELQQEVEFILYDITSLHIDLKGMNIRVLDSVLYLEGNISSSLRSDIAEDQAMGVPGLLEIKNNLVSDDHLAGELAMAYANDPRTRDLPIGVYPRLGVIRLGGAVHTSQQKAAAGEIARNFPGVRSVLNELVVNPDTDVIHIMAPAEGGEAEDKVPGKYVRHTK
ncbi:MAG TPA: BON domain-containing protein [Ktedonobacteraceae bacterium]|nr:BON domain-containing protein [Ktedonobacteraceae bacterium]